MTHRGNPETPTLEPALDPSPDRADDLRVAETAEGKTGIPAVIPWIAAVTGAVGGLGALELLRGRYQKQSTFTPQRYPQGVWDPGAFDLPAEDVWFDTEDEVKLHGWWIPHPEARGTVLYCHGRSGSIGSRLGIFRRLYRLGVDLLAFDYRGYGRSEGVPSERGLCLDVQAAHDYLTEVQGRAPESILLFGHSLGGAVAVDGASHREVCGLVVEASFTDLKDMARVLSPQVPLHLLTRNGFRSGDKVGELDCPKLFIHGTEDTTVPLALGRRLYEAAAEPKDLYIVEGAHHNDLHLKGREAYYRRLALFFSDCFA
jgi:fermentation-respiration switch protein FrsA (DUF1100 family)